MGYDSSLQTILNRLVAVYVPELVYLFGSAARGDATSDSDLDFLIVVPDAATPEQRTSRLGYEALWDIPRSADIVVWGHTAFERRARVPASLPGTVLREGRLLYAV